MIIFQTLRYKNFLSTGNKFTEIKLDKTQTTLIVGQNGSGKSTMLDALAFALFGKSHRNINKAQLINSVNKKDCLVEVEFKVGSSDFLVRRGIKPNVFEIWKNGTMLNQSSNAKEYQKILESNILKINHKSFHQVVVLGSSSFVPFMQLVTAHRRAVIEDLLDINVFSKMNQILKEEMTVLKEGIKELNYQIDLHKNKIFTQKKYITDVKLLTEQNVASRQTAIEAAEDQIKSLTQENIDLSAKVDADQGPLEKKLNGLTEKKQNFLSYSASFKTQIGTIAKEAKFYEDNESCPTCSQDISSDIRSEKLTSAKTKAKQLSEAMEKLSEESSATEASIRETQDLLSEVRSQQQNIHYNNLEIARLQKQISDIREELDNTVETDLKKANDDLNELIETLGTLAENKTASNEEYSYKLAIGEMLKDTGIKTKIIKQYLPVMNQLVNQYLQVLDFFVSFDLDEEFNETIRSRHRDDFSYDSFSEGEKQRIDLALLFTWRQIAKMKNSVATNLLILDETFDSSLDGDGVENLLKILYTLGENSNIFVISHKGEILDGRFKEKIEFKKEKNFSTMVV